MCYYCSVGLIEAVPNVSEGRRLEVIAALRDAMTGCPGVHLLDTSSDTAHNRTVFTLVGEGSALKNALLALFAVAVDAIDLRSHTGVHPRIGAVDVVPLVPLTPADMPVCVALATEVAAAVAERFDIPVYLYEDAARVPERRRLETIRHEGFEGLTNRMQTEIWRPDFGPAHPHPSAGASAVGARPMLVAYNVNLDTGDVAIARRIARAVRASDGGLPAVKAIGVRTAQPHVVQVSINLVDYERTPLDRVYEAVQREADRCGVVIRSSEIVGLVPAAALLPAATRQLQLEGFTMDQILTCRLPR
ncbi:MAG: glutamate formimidoyltransferase [Acidobacteria bacterium]|jgi:glutamate formiminotransferase|nr:glutamate formimidoyltransferase [Acidobacteriota bacterium]MDP7477739.1 glutamate formimidoyltransferase [Vicinamibacterales bacterium]MDP7693311.1 glutamate formimidoyltransferase [Vicinamibacterales bacterium]HJN46436.1 glutamate formimidoyltransferase [Vicinamibacterales bacterium]